MLLCLEYAISTKGNSELTVILIQSIISTAFISSYLVMAILVL